MSEFRRGVRIGVDVGSVRVGVARCDAEGLLAVPLETIARDDQTFTRLGELVAEHEPIEVLVGLPLNLRGGDTRSTEDARAFASELQQRIGIPVRLVDERLSTVSAHTALRASGRSQRQSRSMVDQVAAVVLLQQAVDTEKGTGRPAGILINANEGPL